MAQTPIKKMRTLTIQSEVRLKKYGKAYHAPRLLLQGLWLQEAGFTVGMKVQVEIHPERLIIKGRQ